LPRNHCLTAVTSRVSMSAVAALREQLETEASAYRHLQKDLGKSVQARNAYMQQMQENQMVMKVCKRLGLNRSSQTIVVVTGATTKIYICKAGFLLAVAFLYFMPN